MKKKCKHPPKRHYSWIANDALGKSLEVACCDCGKFLGRKWLKESPKGRKEVKHER